MIAVTVQFRVAEGRMEDFLPLITANARASVADESGCHGFEVWTDPARPDAVWLHEVYADEAAFDTHRTMPHFHRFEAEAAGLIAEKSVVTWARRHA